MLVRGEDFRDRKIIAEDIPARDRLYNWEIFIWQAPEENYKIAIFEYPWQEGGLIKYSDDFFTILGPQFASCDELSIQHEWPHISSDFPGLRKAFITREDYSGDLGGLEGADQKCQQEAEEKKLEGEWKAFLGDDKDFAVDRLDLEGVFVVAEPAGLLAEEITCHRLLGRDFKEFFEKLSDPIILNREKFTSGFLRDLQNIWLGKIDRESKRECIYLDQVSSHEIARRYSFTTTCQNWSINRDTVQGYPPAENDEISLPRCYTPLGERVGAAALAGLSTGVIETEDGNIIGTEVGKSCRSSQKLICVQQ